MSTYGLLAEALGSPAAARWVGQELLHHDCQPDCVCHRVVRSTGELGSHVSRHPALKRQLLAAEGVPLDADGVAPAAPRFDRFNGAAPLAALQRRQEAIARQAVGRGGPRRVRFVAALDVSYVSRVAGPHGVAAYVLADVIERKIVWSTTVEQPVTFPYLSGFLAFREAPLLDAVWDAAHAAGRQADVYLVDGSGVLHPRGAGSATHFGVTHDLPVIGLTKRRLCGTLAVDATDEQGRVPILVDNQRLGMALPSVAGRGRAAKSRRWLYVSPGHRLSVGRATQVVSELMWGRRLPEPLYWADRLSREAARQRMSRAKTR